MVVGTNSYRAITVDLALDTGFVQALLPHWTMGVVDALNAEVCCVAGGDIGHAI